MELGELVSVGVQRLSTVWEGTMTRIAEVFSTRRVMTRIAEVSSTRRVIWDWESLRL